ncbi:MAG TPA: hypothetical protein VGJ05_17705 [Fimbriiglobus sp.]|jgi:hypothetical protein
MTRTRDKLALFFLLMLGAWGCGRNPASADLQKKQLENRTAKLEADLSETTALLNEAEQKLARELARGRAAERDAQIKLGNEKSHGLAVERERDELYGRLKQTTGQRDATQVQYETLVKKLEGVLVESKASMAKSVLDEKAEEPTKATTTTVKRTGDE